MTIDEAIQLLTTATAGWPAGDNVEKYFTAVELGIEALKRVQKARQVAHSAGYIGLLKLLPGEEER